MQDFINYVYNFISQLYNSVLTVFNNSETYKAFLNKQIIGGTLLNIGLTWKELFLYASTWFVAIFFIVFVFHIVYKIIGLIKI